MILTNDNSNLSFNIILTLVIILIVILVLVLVLFPIIKKYYMYRNFKMVYYKKIRAIVDKNDYLLINNAVIKDNNDVIVSQIDHIIFAKKYIYVIKDRFYRGALAGEKDDNVWIFSSRNNEKIEIHNPLNNNLKRIDRLSEASGIDRSLFISIVVVNKDCVIKNYKDLNGKKSYIVPFSKLAKLIKDIEKKANVKEIDQESLELAVKDIYRYFGKGREDNEKEN